MAAAKASDLTSKAGKLACSIKAFLGDWTTATTAGHGLPTPPAKQKQAKGSHKAAKANAANKASSAQTKTKKAAPKDPKDEAIGKLMQELDEKINKAKRCKLEDIFAAVASLEQHEQQVLSSITAVYCTQLLPEKQANEAMMAIRDTLCAAAAAHSYQRPQTPEASTSSAAAFRQQGLPAACALQAGFTAGQLLRAGYSTAELVRSEAPWGKLRAAGVSVGDLYSHLPPDAAAQLSGVSGAAALKAAGYTLRAVQASAAAGAFSDWDLKLAGYQLPNCPDTAPAAPGSQSPRGTWRQASFVQIKQQPLPQQQQQLLGPGAAQQSQLPCQQQRQEQTAHSAAVEAHDLQYFRHQVVPLMLMKPEVDVPPLLLGTRASASVRSAGVGPGQAVQQSRSAARTASSTSRAAAQKIKWQLSGGLSSKQHVDIVSSATELPVCQPAAAAAGAAAVVPAGTMTSSESP